MDVDVYPSKEGDYIPEDATLIDQINQVRLNRVYLHRPGESVWMEVNLVDWLMAVTDLLNGCLNNQKLIIDRRMSFAGEMFHGSCDDDGKINLQIWDVSRRQPTSFHLLRAEAVELHEKVTDYLKSIVLASLGGLGTIQDFKRITLD